MEFDRDDVRFRFDSGARFQLRVGALVWRDDSTLLITNPAVDYYYSVGGAVHALESAEHALHRELVEEVGGGLRVGPLAVVHEAFFADALERTPWHEVSLYFRVDVPRDFVPAPRSVSMRGTPETVHWLTRAELRRVRHYPVWLGEFVPDLVDGVKHFVTHEGQ